MKKVYQQKTKIKLNLVNRDTLQYEDVSNLRYGEVPKNKQYVRNFDSTEFESEYFKELYSEFCNFRYERFQMWKTLFKKRLYIEDLFYHERRIYKDRIVSCEYEKTYEIVSNATTKQLKEDLTFNEYSELVFDREQELKKLIIEKEK